MREKIVARNLKLSYPRIFCRFTFIIIRLRKKRTRETVFGTIGKMARYTQIDKEKRRERDRQTDIEEEYLSSINIRVTLVNLYSYLL